MPIINILDVQRKNMPPKNGYHIYFLKTIKAVAE